MLQNKFFRTCLGIIAILLIIYLASKVSFIFQPLLLMFNILIIPLSLAGFMYYLLRPIVNYLHNKNMHRSIAILLIFLVITGLVILFFILVWPTLREQMFNFIDNTPFIIDGLQQQFNELQRNRFWSKMIPSESEITSNITELVNRLINTVTDSVANFIGVVSNVVIIIATVPIILYYMLKESHKLPDKLMHLVPRRYRRDGRQVLTEIDTALSQFIVGRVLLNLALGVMMYIGFLILGLKYSLLLAVLSAILNFIPYVGAILATIPVMVVGFIQSPSTAIWALVIILVAQQIQDNILTPVLYGKQLDVHPLTIVVLLLIGADIYGILGLILAVPFYMVLKILLVRIYELFLSEKVDEMIE